MSNDAIITIDREIPTIAGTIIKPSRSYSRFESIHQHKLALDKQISKSTIVLTPDHFNTNRTSTISKFEIAQIQLNAILNDRIESLPMLFHNIRTMSSEDISRQFYIQPFILQRLLRIIHTFSNHHDKSTDLNENNIICLIRILNSTLDVKVLILFMMINETNDKYVAKDKLKQFMEIYLENISFDNDRISNTIQAFLKKFHCEMVRLFLCVLLSFT